MADDYRIDLNLLRIFHAILEEGSLTLAGNRLGLSQPAVSYALGRLRGIFNDPLFVRTGNEMHPTSASLAMREPLQRAITATNNVLHFTQPFEPGQTTRTFLLAMSDIGALVFLPKLCDRLSSEAPGIRLDILSMPLDHVAEALRNGEIDLAVGNMPNLKRSTRFVPLFHEEYVCMTRKRENLPERHLSREQFLAMSHILVKSAENAHEQIEEHFLERGIQRKIALRIPHFTAVPEILRRSDWIVTVPRRVAPVLSQNDEFVVYKLPVTPPQVTVTAHWHENFEFNEAHRWLRQLVIDTLREDDEHE